MITGKAENREIDPTNTGNHNQFIFLIMHSLSTSTGQKKTNNYVVITFV